MPLIEAFHEVRFPTGIALRLQRRAGAQDQKWWRSARAGSSATSAGPPRAAATTPATGLRSLAGIHDGRRLLRGAARPRSTASAGATRPTTPSAPPGTEPTAFDQPLGTGTGSLATFQLVKRYGGAHAPYERVIAKPVAGGWTVGSVPGAVVGSGSPEPAAPPRPTSWISASEQCGVVTLGGQRGPSHQLSAAAERSRSSAPHGVVIEQAGTEGRTPPPRAGRGMTVSSI